MERRGMKVVIHGRGKVKSQSIAAGTTAERGAVCNLYMDI
jgi:hypothetical protein